MKHQYASSIGLVGAMCAFFLPAAHGQALRTGQANIAAALDIETPAVVARSVRLGHTSPQHLLHISVSLTPTDPFGLQAYADSVSNPASPNYRKFLTPEQVGAMFGVSQAAVNQVADYLKSKGLTIRLVAKNHLSVLADGTVAQAEAAFATRIDDFSARNPNEAGNPRFYSFSQPLRVPVALKPLILDVTGLESFTRPQFRALTPNQARTLYNLAPIYNAGMHGEGRTVGISNWDGYRLSNVPLYYSHFGLPTPPGGVGTNITVVTISGGAGGGTPGAEGDLDIQMVLGMAPLCNLRIYDGGNSDLIGVLTQEANDNLADVISESYGWSLPASTATAAHNQHLSMTAEGITYMAASGDSGTSIEPYSYPNYDPEVLMVGGTVASTDSAGNRLSEVGWSGSGGGWSTNTAIFNVLPSWQIGNGVPTTINHRLSPDVALHASSSSGAYQFYLNGSLTSGYIGTSFASPVFAGSLAVAEQKIIGLGGLPANGAGKQRFGRIQDLFYSQNGRADVWFDILTGSSGRLPDGSTANAGPGWDFVTGWGAINFDTFVSTQVSAGPDFSVSATPASQTVTPGGGTSYTATVTSANGFLSSVDLTVSGLPSGASASFNPSTVAGGSGTSTLSVSTVSTTPAGSYTLTITGTSGTLVHTTTVTLVVSQPNFSLSASPSSVSVSRSHPNGGADITITVTPIASFGGTVALSVSGLPTGVSATFTPAQVMGGSGTSNLNLMPSSSTPRGTYSLTVRGISGTLSHTTIVTLKVNR
jgi:subtilase family serine protease